MHEKATLEILSLLQRLTSGCDQRLFGSDGTLPN